MNGQSSYLCFIPFSIVYVTVGRFLFEGGFFFWIFKVYH